MKKYRIGSPYLWFMALILITGCAQPNSVANNNAALSDAALAEQTDAAEPKGTYDIPKYRNVNHRMRGKEFYVFRGSLPVLFPHQRHQEAKIACATCHTDNKAQMMSSDRDTGHAHCVTCHRERRMDVKCDSCHK